MHDWVLLVAVVLGYLVVTQWLLPKLGIST
jgi:hypothetical protein